MSEERYKVERLEEYKSILTSHGTHSRFKMEFKLADNPVPKSKAEAPLTSLKNVSTRHANSRNISANDAHGTFQNPKLQFTQR